VLDARPHFTDIICSVLYLSKNRSPQLAALLEVLPLLELLLPEVAVGRASLLGVLCPFLCHYSPPIGKEPSVDAGMAGKYPCLASRSHVNDPLRLVVVPLRSGELPAVVGLRQELLDHRYVHLRDALVRAELVVELTGTTVVMRR